MLQRITGPLPDWANREHPMLHYQLRQSERITTRGRILRAVLLVLVLAALGIGGYAIATNVFTQPAGQNLTEIAVNIVFYPVVIVQVGVSIAALALTVGVVSEERSHLTWDNLRATPIGAGLTLRTRWAAVFYRLRGVLGAVTFVRLFLIAGVLLDLTAFQGRYLDLLIGGIEPNIPAQLGGIPFAVPAAALMLSLFLTAALLLPFTWVAFDAAVGLFLSNLLGQRVYSLVVQFLLFVLRIGVVGGLVWFSLRYVDGGQTLESWQAWLTMFSFAAVADWGLMMLQLGFAGEIWATVPYGIFIGPALLVFALVQALFADLILRWAVHIAENRD